MTNEPGLVTLSRPQYEAELAEAYERGRVDERKSARESAQQAMIGNRRTSIATYLRARGWRQDIYKTNGVEWVDRNGNFRVGVPHKLTPKSWMHIVDALAKYYGGSSQAIATEILSMRGSN